MELFDTLIYFANEREQVRLNKEANFGLLTMDPIINKYRFCNIRRRDDRVTKWLLKNYYTNNVGDVWFKALIARLINWPPTLQYLMDKKLIVNRVEEFDGDEFIKQLDILRLKGEKMYSSAYVVYPTNVVGATKAANLTSYIINPTVFFANDIRKAISNDSIEEVTTVLSQSFGIKTFLAGQVSADLTYIMGQLMNAKDLCTWAPIGPGSKRGLNRLHNRTLTKNLTQEQFNSELIEVRGKLINSNSKLADLTLHDCQNIMCEYDKYIRVDKGEGKPRQLYKTTQEF